MHTSEADTACNPVRASTSRGGLNPCGGNFNLPDCRKLLERGGKKNTMTIKNNEAAGRQWNNRTNTDVPCQQGLSAKPIHLAHLPQPRSPEHQMLFNQTLLQFTLKPFSCFIQVSSVCWSCITLKNALQMNATNNRFELHHIQIYFLF